MHLHFFLNLNIKLKKNIWCFLDTNLVGSRSCISTLWLLAKKENNKPIRSMGQLGLQESKWVSQKKKCQNMSRSAPLRSNTSSWTCCCLVCTNMTMVIFKHFGVLHKIKWPGLKDFFWFLEMEELGASETSKYNWS